MPKRRTDIAASVRVQLLNLARQRGTSMELLLTRYALERLLYRLSLSNHRDRFVLKGALLMTAWFEVPHPATRGLELLGFGDSDPEALVATFREICAVPCDDGVEFDTSRMRLDPIREPPEYGGVRLRTTAALSGARIPVAVDIGFGDAVEPGIEAIQLPVLLDMPSPQLRAYPRESVIAEKFQAMVALGRANSRMKDFYDVWTLLRTQALDPERLARAVAATFERRKTALPKDLPEALTSEFPQDRQKQRQWSAFARELGSEGPCLERVVADIHRGLTPVLTIANNKEGNAPA